MVDDFAWFKWVVPVTPEDVARALMRGLQKGSAEILVGWQSYATVWLNRLLPGLVERLVRLAVPTSKTAPKQPVRRNAASMVVGS